MRLSTIILVLLTLSAGFVEAQETTGDYYREHNQEEGSVNGSLNSNSGNTNSNNLEVNGGQTTYNGTVQNVRSSRNTPSMNAPMATSGLDTCVVGMSGSASGPGFGISYGKGKSDKNCERIKLAKALQSIGLNDAAVAMLAQDNRVAEAIRLAYPKLAVKVIAEDQAAEEIRLKQEGLWEQQRVYEETYWNNVNYLRQGGE